MPLKVAHGFTLSASSMVTAIFLISLCEPTLKGQSEGSDRQPNIIFIMADDLGWGDLGSYGQKRIRTPHLDRMAAEGMRFTQVYAGSTVCAPSRSVLMTGLHTGHTRVRGNARVPLQPGDRILPEFLKTRGYQTALMGKWGLGEPGTTGAPNRKGFDHFFGYLNQRHAHNYYPSHLWKGEQKVSLDNIVPNEDATGAGISTNKLTYSHDLIFQEAMQFVKAHTGQPFFLYLPLTIPHANNEAKGKGMEVPSLGDYAAKDWPAPQKAHAAMISHMDRDIGRLFLQLQTLKIEEDTIVFFTSDNGPHKEGGNDPEFNDSNGPLRGIKRSLHEGGIRVPMIVKWPGKIHGGVVNDTVWTFTDVLPTLLEVAGKPAPKGLDGVSLLPTLLGQSQDLTQRFLYWEFHERGFKQAARWGPWKAIRLGFGQPLQLFHLEDDIGESHDVANRYPEVVEKLTFFLDHERTESTHWPVQRP